jgi:hypothetical protein
MYFNKINLTCPKIFLKKILFNFVSFVSYNSYLCNQLGNALFCVTSGIFEGRAQRDPAKSHELHKIALHFLMCYIQDFF